MHHHESVIKVIAFMVMRNIGVKSVEQVIVKNIISEKIDVKVVVKDDASTNETSIYVKSVELVIVNTKVKMHLVNSVRN